MWTCNAASAECLVYSYKDGLLSAVAHDLQIKVSDWDLQVDPDKSSVSGRFSATSLVVEGAVHDGQLAPSALSSGDKETIRNNIINDVLQARKHGDIRFQSRRVSGEGDRWEIEGDLTLHGTSRPVKANVRLEGSDYVTEVRLNQPDYGIKPYSAMLGTLKIKPEVKVVLRVPKPTAG